MTILKLSSIQKYSPFKIRGRRRTGGTPIWPGPVRIHAGGEMRQKEWETAAAWRCAWQRKKIRSRGSLLEHLEPHEKPIRACTGAALDNSHQESRLRTASAATLGWIGCPTWHKLEGGNPRGTNQKGAAHRHVFRSAAGFFFHVQIQCCNTCSLFFERTLNY